MRRGWPRAPDNDTPDAFDILAKLLCGKDVIHMRKKAAEQDRERFDGVSKKTRKQKKKRANSL